MNVLISIYEQKTNLSERATPTRHVWLPNSGDFAERCFLKNASNSAVQRQKRGRLVENQEKETKFQLRN